MATACGGLRILELAEGDAGPLVGLLLADNGAEVIKIEKPSGDWARARPVFRMWNRGKKSVVLDLRSSEHDRSVLRDLIASSDVVIDGYRKGVAERLGFGWETARAINPRLIYCSIDGFGPLEQFDDIPAYEGVVLAKAGKMMGLDSMSGAAANADADRPLFSASPVASYSAGQLAAQGILAALLLRKRTGVGEHVSTSLFAGLTAGVMRQRFKREDPENDEDMAAKELAHALIFRGVAFTFLTAECKDGKFIQMCARQDQHFRNWMHIIGLEDLLAEPRYAGAPLGMKRMEDIEEFEQRVKDRMLERTQSEWMELFTREADVGADPFLTFDEFLEHPQMVENGRIVEFEDDEVGSTKQLGPLVLFEKTPSRIERGAPRLGANTDEVVAAMRENGYHPALDRAVPQPDTAPPASTDRDFPLRGITIIELAYFLAAPLGPTLLAEMGARVIKVEPLAGDPFRRVGLEAAPTLHGKESIALDLKTKEGQEIVHRLIANADAFLSNFRPGAVDRLGCDYETLRKINPRLVYLYGSLYGSKGPEARRPGFHSTPAALSGAGILQAGRGNAPVDDSFGDPCGGIAAGTALMLGLWAREQTGEGQYLETTMLSSAGYVWADRLVQYAGAPAGDSVDGEQSGYNALYRLYPAKTGWVFLAILNDGEWGRLASALGHQEWLGDRRFADSRARTANDAALVERLAEEFGKRSADEWEEMLVSRKVACVRADAGNIEEFVTRHGYAIPAEHPSIGSYWRMPGRARFESHPSRLDPITAVGECTGYILAELGYEPDEIHRMVEASIVRDAQPAAIPG